MDLANDVKKYFTDLQDLSEELINGKIDPKDIDEKGLIEGRVRVGSFLLEDRYYEAGDSPNIYAGVYIMSDGQVKYKKEGNATMVGFEGPFEVLKPIEGDIFYDLREKDLYQRRLDKLNKDFSKLRTRIFRSQNFKKKVD